MFEDFKVGDFIKQIGPNGVWKYGIITAVVAQDDAVGWLEFAQAQNHELYFVKWLGNSTLEKVWQWDLEPADREGDRFEEI